MKLLLYCTKAKPYLSLYEEGYGEEIKLLYGTTNDKTLLKQLGVGNPLNGKIVAECDFEVEELTNCGTSFMIMKYDDLQESYRYTNEVARGSCLDYTDLRRYLGTKNGYAIHIKNLHIFDKPKELSDYYTRPKKMNTLDGYSYTSISLDKAPQNMMYCCDEEEKDYILISIQPQWLCKILNEEKTIEVRKKVLKEMLI